MKLEELKGMKELSRREASAAMSPCPTVAEGKKTSRTAAVVNDSGRLVGFWRRGKSTQPTIVRENTKLGVVMEKGLPAVVVDSHRRPVGLVTLRDLGRLAGEVREYEVPIFYSGLDMPEAGRFRFQVSRTVEKISRIVKPKHLSVRVACKGVWEIKLKMPTSLRTFVIKGQGHSPLSVLNDCLKRLELEVIEEKDKRLKLRQ